MALTGYALVDDPNPFYTQGRPTRRDGNVPVGLGVIHTFEIAPDMLPPDMSAESGLKILRSRTNAGCYHRLCDSDSRLPLYPFEWETWHCRITNKWSNGFCMATQAHRWGDITQHHAEMLLLNCARDVAAWVGWMKDERGVAVPIRWIDLNAAMRKEPGLTMHRITDPSRRTDPGFLPTSRTGNRFLQMVGDLVGTEEVPVNPDWGWPGLLVDGVFGRYTVKALQRALAVAGTDVGPADGDFGPRTRRAYQSWLKRRGFYPGRIDGDFGCMSIAAEQRWLHSVDLYIRGIDCDRGFWTVRGLQYALNKGLVR